MTGVNEDISVKYATELKELKCNSKPLINSLTMMAEDYIRHAPIIVQTIETHLRGVKPELKLPVLYLIDSIVKNVKKEYVQLFTQNIVSTFTQTFEQVSEKTRSQMWKLRQTWNEVFSTKKLYSIDFKCHQTDPGWPITATPPSTASIHVNPKFLARAMTLTPATPTTQSIVMSTISSPSIPTVTGLGGLTDLGISGLMMDPPGDITEAQMREQLLIKQKELLELQTRKLELELLHTKAQLEEKTRKQVELHNTTQQQMETQTKQQQLLQQAEIAKHQTDIATSLLMGNLSSSTSSVSSSVTPIITNVVTTPNYNYVGSSSQSPITIGEDENISDCTTLSSSSSSSPSQSSLVATTTTTSTIVTNSVVAPNITTTTTSAPAYLPDPRKRRARENKSRPEELYNNSESPKNNILSSPSSTSSVSSVPYSHSSTGRSGRERMSPSRNNVQGTLLNVSMPHSISPIRSILPPPSSSVSSASAIVSTDPRRRSNKSPDVKSSSESSSPHSRDSPRKDKDKSYFSPGSSSTRNSHRPRSSPSRSGGSTAPHPPSISSNFNTHLRKSLSPPKLPSSPARDIVPARSISPPSISSSDPRKRKNRDRESQSSSKVPSRDAQPILKERDDGGRNASQSRKSSSNQSTSPGGSGASVSVVNDTSPQESPSKRRKKSVDSKISSSSQRDKDSKDKDGKDSSSSKDKDKDKRSKGKSSSSSSSSSSSRRRRDSENSSSTLVKGAKDLKEKDGRDNRKRVRDDYKFRKSAVLQRNYRRTTEASNMEDEEELIMLGNKKDKENHGHGSSSHGSSKKLDYKKESSKSGGSIIDKGLGLITDIDLRFDNLKDVDLRNDTSGSLGGGTGNNSSNVEPPPMKKSRNVGSANLIADLFGREDVDLRQSSGSSSWSQVKRTPSIQEGSGSDIESIKDDRRLSQSQQDEDIRDILNNRPRPPPAISPAGSLDSVRTNASCDPLGRPLLYNRLPDDPAARKKSLTTVDPVERFRSQFLERPTGGDLTDLDLTKAVKQAQQEFDMGFFTKEQYAVIMRQLMQIHEVGKIRDVQQIQQRGPGPNPWTDTDTSAWNQFGPRGPSDFGSSRFPGPGMTGGWNQMPTLWGQPQPPRGPNPFEEAAAASVPSDDLLPPVNIMELDNVRKDTSGTIPIDKVLRQVRFYGDTAIVLQGMLGDEPREISFRQSDAKNVFIDQEQQPVRCFIGKPVLIYLDRKKHMLKLGAPTRELYIDGDHYEACFGGPPVRVRVDRYLHSFKIEGSPPQVEVGKVFRYDVLAGRVNLFVDGNSVTIYLDEKPQLLDLCGFPVILRFCDGFHTVLLNGRPFPTNFGGNHPMSVTVPQGRKHYLRFSGLTDNTRRAMLHYIRIRESKGPSMRDDGSSLPPMDFIPLGGPFRGRGGRGRGGIPMPMLRGRTSSLFNNPMLPSMGNNSGDMRMPPLPPGADSIVPINDAFHPGLLPQFESTSNPLDVLANIMPSPMDLDSGDKYGNRSMDNVYESDSSMLEERMEIKSEPNVANDPVIGSPLDVQDLLSRLMMAGLLPTGLNEENQSTTAVDEDKDKDKTSADSDPTVIKEEVKDDAEKMDETTEAEGEKKTEPVPVPTPIEVVDVSFDKLKERRDKLIDMVCSGVQCGSCGLRFPPDQTVRYSQHLDWHFRQNRREKANVRKAQSRKWYYDLSDWIQFAEIEDLEERAQSLFESQETEVDGEVRSPGTVLNPALYTVLSAGHDGAVCPQCNEDFESFFDEDKEEWRLRDAFLAENVEEETMKLYHPICHQDYMANLQGKSMLAKVEEKKEEEIPVPVPEVELPSEEKPPDDEDEVLILKEGKPEVEVMDIELEEDDNKVIQLEEKTQSSESTSQQSSAKITEIELIDDELNESIIEKDSDKQNETICINDDDNDNGVDVSVNNKKETTTTTSTTDLQPQNVDSSSISHNNNSNSTNTKIDDASIITLGGSEEDVTCPQNINNNDNNISNTNNDNNINPSTSNNNNISVNVLSSFGSGGSKVGDSPTLVMIDDDTGDEGLFASIPGISDKSVFNIALSSGTKDRSGEEAPYKPIIYESMKFDVPTPRIKTEPVDPDEDPQNEMLSLDDIIKANMSDEAVDGMDDVSTSMGQPDPSNPELVVSGETPVDIDLTGEDEVSNDESNLVAGSAALDGNTFLFETAVSVLPKQVVVSIDAASLKPRTESSKPRLGSRKLTNCPPKVSGKEVSGLCTIC